MQVMLRGSDEVFHEFKQQTLTQLLRIKQQHQTLHPSRYTFMIMSDDLLEFSG